ncbi:MAG: hypothetical protein IJZ36_01790, partial [Bacilli bacterium]|nr:hypothetical protein [Bacilli bacterium]
SNTSSGPTVAVEALNNAIKDKWSANLLRTDSYTHTFNNGTEDKTYTVSYNGMKVRLPEAQEIANAIGHETYDERTSNSWFYLDSKNETQTVGYGKTQTTSSYAWLFNNLSSSYTNNDASDGNTCLYYGCTQNLGKTSGDKTYWTSTSLAGSARNALHVNYNGSLNYGSVSNTRGVRPVITLNSNI